MAYDLNVKCADAKSTSIDFRYISLLTNSVMDNYSVVALNSEHVDMNVAIKPSVASPVSETQLQQSIDKANSATATVNVSGTEGENCSIKSGKSLTQLRRITLEINDGKYLPQLKTNKALATYDIIAIKTRNEKVFHSLCIDHDDYDILTFEMQERLPFLPKRGWIAEAIRKGISFEIAYSDAIDDLKMKRTVLANCINIVKMAKGKNIILSSSTASDFSHRAPFDLIMLGSLIGLDKEQAHDSIYKNPENCVKRSRYRKTYEGTICHASKSDLEEFKAKQLTHAAKIQKKISKKKEKKLAFVNGNAKKREEEKESNNNVHKSGEIESDERMVEEKTYQVIGKVDFKPEENVFLNPNRANKDDSLSTTKKDTMEVESVASAVLPPAGNILSFSISLN